MDAAKEKALRDAIFIPCDTEEHLHTWIKVFLGLDIPNIIICDDEERHPSSNSSPMKLIWEMYTKARAGNDDKFTQVLGYSAREGMKTLSAAIFEVLCLFHLNYNVVHVAALEVQAKNCQKYVEKFLKRPLLRDYFTSKNKRTIEITFFRNKNKDIISPAQYEGLLAGDNKYQYDEITKSIQIIVCTPDGANGLHAPIMVCDELDLADPEGMEEAKMVPSEAEADDNGFKKLPLTFYTSTRKYSFGLVQQEIDNAHNTNLQIRHWNIIDVTQRCSPERHLPDEPKIPIYYSEETLTAIGRADWEKLTDKEKEQYYVKEGYAGCLQNCKLFAACKGRLATKQTSTSPLLKTIFHTQSTMAKVSVATAKAQYLCFAGGTQIFMGDGTCKNIEDIQIGDSVITHKGNVRKVTNILSRHYDGEIYNIFHRNWKWDKPTLVTSEHPYFINGLEFKSVEQINASILKHKDASRIPRDYLSLPCDYEFTNDEYLTYTDFIDNCIVKNDRVIYNSGGTCNSRSIPLKIKLNKEFGWILGFFLAEGSFSKRKYSKDGKIFINAITFSSHSREIEFHQKIRDFANQMGLSTSEWASKTSNYGFSQDIYNTTLANLFYILCGEYCDKKKINDKLMSYNLDFLSGIFEGFWDGDGSKKISSMNEFVTTSYNLATQMFIIAARLGLNPRIKKKNKKNNFKQTYLLYFNNKNWNSKLKHTQFKTENNYNLYRLDYKDLINFSGLVYNITVEGDNSYIANGVAVHNCWKPSSEGLIFPYLSKESHMLTAAQMAQKMTGEEYPSNFSKENLISLMKSMNVPFYSGMDFGFTHYFSVTTAAMVGHILYVFDLITETGLELLQKIALCQQRIGHLKPTVYPDNAYPADIATFKRYGFKMINFDKDVLDSIEAIRTRLNPGTGVAPIIYFLKGDPGIELLVSRMQKYHWKVDKQTGLLTDEPEKKDDDEVDSIRYLCQNVKLDKSSLALAGIKPTDVAKKKDPNAGWIKKKVNELTADSEQIIVKGDGALKFTI